MRFLVLSLVIILSTSCAGLMTGLSKISGVSSSGTSWSKPIERTKGGTIEVTNRDSRLYGVKLTFPAFSLHSDKTITIGEVAAPPPLLKGYNFIGMVIELTPHGLVFLKPATIEIPYTSEELSDAGLSDGAIIKVMSYDPSSGRWENVQVKQIDTVRRIITAELNHFSIIAKFGLNGNPPPNLGKPKPGDLLYRLSPRVVMPENGWRPGHVAIYTGEKPYSGSGLASDQVKEYGVYNVIEALSGGVQYSYYSAPNVATTHAGLPLFGDGSNYMGAREPPSTVLTIEQRNQIIAFAEGQVGRPYRLIGLRSTDVKGPAFNCVGLAEKAYEVAGVNGGEGLVDSNAVQ